MSRLRRRAAALAAVAGLLLGGCAGAPAPPPEPVPVPHYRMAAGHCERLQPDEMAAATGLVVPDDADDPDRQERYERYDRASCWVEFETPDDRFDEVPIGWFIADGYAAAQVFAEPGVAEDRYRLRHTDWERVTDTSSMFTMEQIRGWWDEGLSLRRVDRLVMDPGYRGDLDASMIAVIRVVRHHNLLLEVSVSGDAPTADLDEVERLFTDLTQEIADQMRAALELTTVTVTPSPPA